MPRLRGRLKNWGSSLGVMLGLSQAWALLEKSWSSRTPRGIQAHTIQLSTSRSGKLQNKEKSQPCKFCWGHVMNPQLRRQIQKERMSKARGANSTGKEKTASCPCSPALSQMATRNSTDIMRRRKMQMPGAWLLGTLCALGECHPAAQASTEVRPHSQTRFMQRLKVGFWRIRKRFWEMFLI